jgi:hypothetical protein
MTSGSFGSWPRAPTAYPAKPTPSLCSSSTASIGTSLAHGLPVRSTNIARMNSMPSARARVARSGPAAGPAASRGERAGGASGRVAVSDTETSGASCSLL